MPFSPNYLTKPKLPKFQSSDKGLEDALNTLARAIERIEIPDVRLSSGNMAWSGNSLILTPDPTLKRRPPVDIRPWDIYSIVGDGTPNNEGVYSNYKVKIWPGMVNGILPNNLVGEDGLEEFTVSGSSPQIIKAEVTTDGKSVTEVTITSGTEQPVPQVATLFSLPVSFEFCIAVFVKGKVYRAMGPGNVIATPTLAFLADKEETPVFGTLNHEEYYIWSLNL